MAKITANIMILIPVPFTVSLQDTGVHLLRRYANYHAATKLPRILDLICRFLLQAAEVLDLMIDNINNRPVIIFVITLLFSIFLCWACCTFAFIFFSERNCRIFISAYFPSVWVRFFFSMYLNTWSHSPSIQLKALYLSIPLAATAFLALSAFVHRLFLKKKKNIVLQYYRGTMQPRSSFAY